MNEHFSIDFQGRFKPTFLLELIWRRRYLVLVLFITGITLGVVKAALTTPIYETRMIVGPVDQFNGPSQISGLGDLAALAGVSISTPDNADMQKYKILFTSTLVAAEMEKRYGTLRELLPEAWNAKEERWKRRNEVELGPKTFLKSLLGLYHWVEPGPETLSELLQKDIVFSEVRKSSFLMLTYRCPNPEQGVRLLSRLHDVTSFIYARDLAMSAEAQISYINNALAKEQRQSVRDVLYKLLEDYLNKMVLFRSGQQLLVQLIQPPVASQNPAWPKPAIMMALGGLLGLVAGIAIATLWPTSESFNAALRTRLRSDVGHLNRELERPYTALQKFIRKWPPRKPR